MSAYSARPAHGAAWITGASSGIGRALAVALAQEGFTVVATARRQAKLAELASETSACNGHVVPMPGDVTDADDMARIVDEIERHHGALALAVFNARVDLPVSGEALEVEDFETVFAVNLSGVVKALVPAVEAMRRAGRGQIALVSSVAGYGGLPNAAAYGATKAALINMAESLKFDLDKLGIRIQIVNPGFVDTATPAATTASKPALIDAGEAARRIATGLKTNRFEIAFPKRSVAFLKLLRLLPYGVYFSLVDRATGWSKRPLQTEPDELAPRRIRAR